LIDNARTAPDAMSPSEAKQYMAERGDSLNAEIAKVLDERQADDAFQTQRKEVKDYFTGQLNATKRFTTDVNEAYASLLASGYSALASRAGMTASEMLNKHYGLRVSAESVTGGRTMDQDGNYRIEHRPMTKDGGAASLDDLTPSFGADIYGKNALQFFGSGDAREAQVLRMLKAVRGKPDAMVTVYRGVPQGVTEITPGDWVTLSKEVAADYEDNVISLQVPAAHVTSWSDSLLEFGYYPPAGEAVRIFEQTGRQTQSAKPTAAEIELRKRKAILEKLMECH
jgi:hypothetical protein